MIELLETNEDTVTISVEGQRLPLSLRWIRDHSEDPVSLDPATLQREVDTFSIPTRPEASGARVEDGALLVDWADGSETSIVSEPLLRAVGGLGDPSSKQLWRSPADVSAERHECASVMADDGALLAALDDLVSKGFILFTGIEPTKAGADELCERIARVRSTIFGTLWCLSSESVEFADSAYSPNYLEPHTDATYMTDAPGTQMFCCVERTGEGGENILVDGFAIAADLAADEPDHFRTLTEVVIPGRYVEPGVHLRAARPAIRLDDAGQPEQISFNNYDRAPFWLPEPDMSRFYEAYAALHERIIDRSRWLETFLQPGDAVIFDNWRVMHGRHAYTGKRVFHGCYHDRDDILSRRRVLAAAAAQA